MQDFQIDSFLRQRMPSVSQAQKSSFEELRAKPINYIGGKNPKATVAVLDSFRPVRNGVAHGDTVTQVLQRASGVRADEIQKIDGDELSGSLRAIELLSSPGMESSSERLNAGIELSATEFLSGTNRVLEDIANDPHSKIKTINQSQGKDGLDTLRLIRNMSFDYTEDGTPQVTRSGRHVFEGLGLEPGTDPESMRAFTEQAIERVDNIYSNSPRIKRERQRNSQLSEKLKDRGISYVLSAGNSGSELKMYQQAGIKMPDSFDDNLLSNPHNVVVGAIDTKATPETKDDTIASFSSTDPEVDFLANGVDISVQSEGQAISVSGTSFSAPSVAGKLHSLREENPRLSASQLQTLLRNGAGANVLDSSIAVVR